MTTTKLDAFTRAYVECALWASVDDDGNPMDEAYSIDDIAPEALAKMVRDCQEFQRECADDINAESSIGRFAPSIRAGHDFWLTRNRHGAGFWDGDWSEEAGERLTEASHRFSECYLYVGDDGKLYL